MNFAHRIEGETPKAWRYFQEYYANEFDGISRQITAFNELAFEYQLGVYIRFFDTINTDIQLYSTNMEVLQEAILEAFQTYEEYLFLDS